MESLIDVQFTGGVALRVILTLPVYGGVIRAVVYVARMRARIDKRALLSASVGGDYYRVSSIS